MTGYYYSNVSFCRGNDNSRVLLHRNRSTFSGIENSLYQKRRVHTSFWLRPSCEFRHKRPFKNNESGKQPRNCYVNFCLALWHAVYSKSFSFCSVKRWEKNLFLTSSMLNSDEKLLWNFATSVLFFFKSFTEDTEKRGSFLLLAYKSLTRWKCFLRNAKCCT